MPGSQDHTVTDGGDTSTSLCTLLSAFFTRKKWNGSEILLTCNSPQLSNSRNLSKVNYVEHKCNNPYSLGAPARGLIRKLMPAMPTIVRREFRQSSLGWVNRHHPHRKPRRCAAWWWNYWDKLFESIPPHLDSRCRGQQCFLVGDDKLILQRNHPYYFQIQHQLVVTGAPYCDIILDSPINDPRILLDASASWIACHWHWKTGTQRCSIGSIKAIFPPSPF